MTTVATTELGERLSELLQRVEAGDEVVVVRGGAQIAKLVPADHSQPQAAFAAAVDAWRESRKGLTLGGLKGKDLINEGRR